jgi:hypothetical protein
VRFCHESRRSNRGAAVRRQITSNITSPSLRRFPNLEVGRWRFRRRGVAAADPRYRAPDGFEVDPVILMAQPVPQAADIPPWQAGAQPVTGVTQPDGRFANDLQFAFNRGDGFSIFTKGFEVHAAGKHLDHDDGFQDIVEREGWVFKRQSLPRVQRGRVRAP